MFYREGHRRLFRAMLALTERRGVIDHITLRDELLRRGELETAGGLEYLAELVDAVPTAANLEFHAKIVRDKAILRRLIETSTSIITEAYDGHSTANELLDIAESKIFQISQQRGDEGFTRHQGDAVADDGAHRNAPAQRQSDYRRAQRLRRLGRDDVGLPAVGAGHRGGPAVHGQDGLLPQHRRPRRGGGSGVAIFSLEMSKEALVQRMLTRRGAGGQPSGAPGHACATPTSPSWRGRRAFSRRYQLWIDDTPVPHPAGDALQGAAAQDRQRRAPDRGGLSPAHAEPGVRREPGAGDLRHLALAQGAGAGAGDSGHRAVAALPRLGAAGRRAQADPLRPPRLRRHRAGRRPGHLHPPARSTTTGRTRPSAGWPRSCWPRTATAPPATSSSRFIRRVHPVRQPSGGGPSEEPE